MKSKSIFLCCVCLIIIKTNNAQQQLKYAQEITKEICSKKYEGRGYVNNGVNLVADFLADEFQDMKLKKIENSYFQEYSFSVNTHPFPIQCNIDNKEQKVGYQFLVDAGAEKINGTFSLLHFNMKDSLEKILLYKKIKQGFQKNDALVLHFSNSRMTSIIDSCKSYAHFPAIFIYTEEKKLTHTINTTLNDYPSLIFIDSAIQNKEKIEINAQNLWVEKFNSKNIVGYVKGKNTDSFIVYSAHYDHLGKQGDAFFSGASDNASGISMVLNLANYYSTHKPAYTTFFILFSGEEAGLLGSNYFINHPTFNIQHIKMLVNIDIMGNAEKGITVVDGEVYKKQFDLLSQINNENHFLPEVKIRGKAKNSDHYFFSEKGIPAFFIYSMGGQGYYHDVFDKADALQFTNYENVFKLLIEFQKRL